MNKLNISLQSKDNHSFKKINVEYDNTTKKRSIVKLIAFYRLNVVIISQLADRTI